MSVDDSGPDRNGNRSEMYLTTDDPWNQRDREPLPQLRPRRAVGWEWDFEPKCNCEKCSRIKRDSTVKFARDDKALTEGELGPKGEDGLKDITALETDEYAVEREEVGSHRTIWMLSDVATGIFTDFARWKEMWYWQVGLKPSGKVTSRGPCDEDSRRDTARKLGIAEAFASQFGCTESQLRQIRSMLLQIDVSRLGYYGENRVAALAVIDGVTKKRRLYTQLDTNRSEKTTLVSSARTIETLFKQVNSESKDYSDDRVMQFAKSISETYDIDAEAIRGAQEAIRNNTPFENFGLL